FRPSPDRPPEPARRIPAIGWICMNRVRRSPLLIALGLILITPAGPLRAQVNGPHVSIFPWAGYANFAKNVNFKDKPIYGGSLGLFVHKYVGIEGHLGYQKGRTITGFTHYAIEPLPLLTAPEEFTMLHYGD